MANDKRRDRSGRVTPKRGAAGRPSGPAGRGAAGPSRQPAGPSGPPRRWRMPASIGPFSRPDTDAPLGQVGKRPSSPANLLMIGLAWVGCGVVALLALTASWKIIPGVVFIGIGLLFIRGGFTAVSRHEQRREHED